MADNVLKASITADGSKFNKTLSELEAQLKRFQNALKNTSSVESFNRLNRAISETKSRIASISTVKDPLQKVTQGSNAATQSLINVGRVAQDLPFGFIGIANNLNPLLESFQRLKVESGSNASAFKSLASSLSGPAGIGVALSVVSSLLISFGDALFGSKAASKASEEALKSFSETIDRVKDSVKSLSTELAFLNQLGSINIKIRGQGSLQDLREQSIAQRQLTADLERQRDKLRALETTITNNTKLNSADREKALQSNADAVKDINDEILASENKSRILFRQIELQKVEDQKDSTKKQKETYDNFVSETIAKAKELASFLNANTIRDIEFEVDPRDTLGETLKKALDFIEKTKDITKNFKVKFNFFQAFDFKFIDDKLFKDLPKETEDLQKKVQKEIQDLTDRNPILLEFKNLSIKITADRKKLESDLKDLQTGIKEAVGGAVEGIAATIGDALSGKNPLAGVLNVIGDLIQQIGRALIKFAIVRGILDKILKNPLISPSIAFALGAAAIAIGQLVKNIKPSGARASGGGVNAGQGYYVGEQGKELFVPNTAGRIIPNNSLPGNTGRVQAAPVLVAGRLVASGNDLIAVLSSATRSQNRLS